MSPDRKFPGRKLAEKIKGSFHSDRIVFSSVRDFVVAREVALELEVPLTFIASMPLSVDGVEIGAVSEDGTLWLDDTAVADELFYSINTAHAGEETAYALKKVESQLNSDEITAPESLEDAVEYLEEKKRLEEELVGKR
ncbi:MAG: hypothetical protein ABEJ95_05085 [Candidatus Nanohalobium sp.]